MQNSISVAIIQVSHDFSDILYFRYVFSYQLQSYNRLITIAAHCNGNYFSYIISTMVFIGRRRFRFSLTLKFALLHTIISAYILFQGLNKKISCHRLLVPRVSTQKPLYSAQSTRTFDAVWCQFINLLVNLKINL